MSKNASVQDLLLALQRPRNKFLEIRDAAYAAAKQHPRLTPDGALINDDLPLAEDLIGMRPLTIEEQVARFTDHGVMDFNLVPDEQLLARFPNHFATDDDDWGDHLDDLPDEGYSPYEILAFDNIENYYARLQMTPDELRAADATPLPEDGVEGPHKATPEPSSPSDLSEGK